MLHWDVQVSPKYNDLPATQLFLHHSITALKIGKSAGAYSTFTTKLNSFNCV